MSVMLSALTGFYAWGGSIDEVLYEWERLGIFEWVLPFLLIFAIIFGILTKSGVLGDNKGVNTVISLAAALLSIQSITLRSFFPTIFSYAGIGLAILLVALILTGLFRSEEKWWSSIFLGVGGFIALVVVLMSLSSYNWAGGWWWMENWPAIITLVIIVGLMLLVILATKAGSSKSKTP